MKNISIIVAIAENNAIGRNNDLLWHIPDDLKRFKKITSEHTVVMGRNTYLSLPVKPLPKRRNIVITDKKGEHFTGCEMAYSIEEALSMIDDKEESFVIGGGMIYKIFLDHANKLYITKVHKLYDADTFFPEINPRDWKIVSEEKSSQDSPEALDFTYLVLARKLGVR